MNKRVTPPADADAPSLLLEIVKQLDAPRKAREDWLAKLTPEQRRAHDEAEKRKRQLEETRKLEAKIQNAARPYRGRDSLPIKVFAAVLHGIDADSIDWGFFSDRELNCTIELFESCVGVSLNPVDATEPRSKRRFATRSLIAVAHFKRYPNVDVVARALGFEPPAQPTTVMSKATAPAPAPAKASSRQTLVIESIEEMIAWAAREGYGKPAKQALPFRRQDLFEYYQRRCKERGLMPLKETRFRDLMRRHGYRLKPGIDDQSDIALLHHWRNGERTKPG